jgi:hypothetical protein
MAGGQVAQGWYAGKAGEAVIAAEFSEAWSQRRRPEKNS